MSTMNMRLLPFLLAAALPSFSAPAPASKAARTAFAAALETFKKDASDANREAVIKAALGAVRPVPEEAERRLARGEAAFELAKSPSEYEKASAEFRAAADAAPWLATPYFNLGVAEEKSDRPREAMRYFRWYLLAAPGAKDAAEIKKRIFKLEYAAEQQGQAQAAASSDKRFEGPWVHTFRSGSSGLHQESLVIKRGDAGFAFLRRVDGGEEHAVYGGFREVRIEGGQLRYFFDKLGVENLVCGTYDVRGTISEDGRTLTMDHTLLPFAATRSYERCALPSFFASYVEKWTKQ